MKRVYTVAVQDHTSDESAAAMMWPTAFEDLETAKLAVAEDLLNQWSVSEEKENGEIEPPIDWMECTARTDMLLLVDYLVTFQTWTILGVDLK